LYEDIEDMAVLVDGASQIVPLSVNGEKDFIQVPLVPRSGTPAAQLIGVCPPGFPTPIPHRLIGQDDATSRHELFDIQIAQAETKI
jgi:hypothetical protein